jgi:hypothetical protein
VKAKRQQKKIVKIFSIKIFKNFDLKKYYFITYINEFKKKYFRIAKKQYRNVPVAKKAKVNELLKLYGEGKIFSKIEVQKAISEYIAPSSNPQQQELEIPSDNDTIFNFHTIHKESTTEKTSNKSQKTIRTNNKRD